MEKEQPFSTILWAVTFKAVSIDEFERIALLRQREHGLSTWGD